MQKKLVYLSLIAIVILAACQQGKRPGKEGINRDTSHYTKQEYIAQTLDSNFVGTFLDRNPQFAAYGEAIRDFYRKRGYHYAWINEEGITEQAGGFMNMMRQDEESGIKDSTLDKSRVMALYDSLAL